MTEHTSVTQCEHCQQTAPIWQGSDAIWYFNYGNNTVSHFCPLCDKPSYKIKPMTETKQNGTCAKCEYIGPVVTSEGRPYFLHDNGFINRDCPKCGHWHRYGTLELVEESPELRQSTCSECGGVTHLKKKGNSWEGPCQSCRILHIEGLMEKEQPKFKAGDPVYFKWDGKWRPGTVAGFPEVAKMIMVKNHDGFEFLCGKNMVVHADEYKATDPAYLRWNDTEKKWINSIGEIVTPEKVKEDFYNQFAQELIEGISKQYGLPASVLQQPIDSEWSAIAERMQIEEELEQEKKPFQTNAKFDIAQIVADTTDPPFTLELDKTYYAVRSRRTGLFFDPCFKPWSASIYPKHMTWPTEDRARLISERCVDAEGNPEPVEIVKIRLVCEGVV